MLSRRTGGVGLLALAVLSLGSCRNDEREAPARVARADSEVAALDPGLARHLPPGTTMAMAEEGRKLYVVCAVCHGPDAGGTQLGPPLRGGGWIDLESGSLEEIERVVREGVAEPKKFQNPMPVMGAGDFDDAQVRAIATYVYALSHASAPPPPATDSAADSAR